MSNPGSQATAGVGQMKLMTLWAGLVIATAAALLGEKRKDPLVASVAALCPGAGFLELCG